jgi:hypothetical protein
MVQFNLDVTPVFFTMVMLIYWVKNNNIKRNTETPSATSREAGLAVNTEN